MKNLLLISLTFLLIAGCYEKDNNAYHLSWATLDSRVIQSELLRIVKRQNPYPGEINIDRNQLRKKMRNLSSQINTLVRAARQNCMPDKPQSSESKSKSMRYRSPYNAECINKINSDPLISDLKAKKENLSSIYQRRSQHDLKIKLASKAYVDTLVREYSKNKFELVISNRKQYILYNKKGLSIDITEAILNRIKSNEPKIAIQ